MAVVELTEEPRVDYLRAAIGLLAPSRPAGLPEVELVRRGVRTDRAHLTAYESVCGFRVTDVLPATYPHLLAFPLAMRLMSGGEFPFPVVGLVHVANRITVRRPLVAQLPLDLSVRAEALRPHERGTRFDIVATATVDGAPVWSETSTYLSKNRGTGRRREPAPAPASSAVWQVPARTGRDYAAVSGDRNPIHTSRLGARLFGFPRPIAHGMWTKARCLAALEGRLPDAYTVDVAFQQPILLPSRVSFAAWPESTGWEFSVHGDRPHLAGQLTPP
nr:MaoC/PaaZ C-terminal domain-containing protein [uncultured Actinoplanes sp.]